MSTLAVILAAGLIGFLLLVIIVVQLIHICAPNEVLIFSGTKRQVGNRTVGYRLIQGGRGIRIPLLERVDTMDLTNMIIDVKVVGAYARGGIPLNVEGVANLKIAGSEPVLGNAIERFLGAPRELIMRVARETLEGNLRGILATLTPEEVNRDRVKFAQELLHEADKDLSSLGLELDTLKIQHVSDDKSYLDSLGRQQSAELLMRSRIAEAENWALSAKTSASNFENQEMARIEAAIATTRADANKRILDAQTKKGAMVAEERATVTALVAKAEAELDVQRARLDQVKFQLEADVIKPAEARKQKMVEQARGAAANLVEDGKATASALRELATTWQRSGDSARQILLAQKLTPLIGQIMSTVSSLPIDKFTVIDSQLSNGNNLTTKAVVANEQLKQTMGVDLPAILRQLEGEPRAEAGRRATPPVLK